LKVYVKDELNLSVNGRYNIQTSSLYAYNWKRIKDALRTRPGGH